MGDGLLTKEFFLRRPDVVAPELLGKIIVQTTGYAGGGVAVALRITETEAYAQDDPASHSFKGVTARNRSMFEEGGCLYVYFIYGIHHCLNVVTEPRGVGSAVLIRAGQPVAGLEHMWRRRYGPAAPAGNGAGNGKQLEALCRGPGNLALALGVTRQTHDGILINRVQNGYTGGFFIYDAPSPPESQIVRSPRIGISKGVDKLWRYCL
jgi:DNA-3-methyladenine glycosylase